MTSLPLPTVPGRGAASNPANRFERLALELDGDETGTSSRTQFFMDRTRSIIAHNQTPDVGPDAGINPYRGCEHGCIYCFARPTHEYLGYSAGLDFETRILVKSDAPRLLRDALAARSWHPRTLMMSGNTDPYQPVERRLGITRRCLEVLADARHPVAVITKNDGILRDLDLLAELAHFRAVAVTISVTSLRRDLQRIMEPRTSTPTRRLRAISELAGAGVPVGVNLAPVIPGLTDDELPAILAASAEAGAQWAGYILLRLPHAVKDLFADWLEAHVPERRTRVLGRLREAYGGALYDARFSVRGKGQGPYADQLRQLFRVTSRRLGLGSPPELSIEAFRRPAPGGQLALDV